jgi:hypothetical protein
MALNPKRQRLNRYDTLEFIPDTDSDKEEEKEDGLKHLVTLHRRVSKWA